MSDTQRRVGKVYSMPPQPPVAENNRLLPAGAITFGVEYRALDPESLAETYAGNAAHLAQLEELSPEGGFTDEGVSIHVCGTHDGHEYLRFDLLDDEPHYHYISRGATPDDVVNNVVDYDADAMGDMLPWVVERLRSRLPAMLRAAGGDDLVEQLDAELVDRAVDEVHAMAERARSAHRAAGEGEEEREAGRTSGGGNGQIGSGAGVSGVIKGECS